MIYYHYVIAQGRNCEDIAMQFAVANHTGRPPLWVVGRYTDAGAFDGISTTTGGGGILGGGGGILGHRAVSSLARYKIYIKKADA